MFMPIGTQLRELESFDSSGAPVLSLYLPTDPLHHDQAWLQRELQQLMLALGADLPPAARADLAVEMDGVRDYLSSMVAVPQALALFSCSRRRFFRVVRLPVPVQPCAFWQERPQTQPLQEAADRAWGTIFERDLAASI
jgi:hypothetical protein